MDESALCATDDTSAEIAAATSALLAGEPDSGRWWVHVCAVAVSDGHSRPVEQACDRVHAALIGGGRVAHPAPRRTGEFFWPWADTQDVGKLVAGGHLDAARRAASSVDLIVAYATALDLWQIEHPAALELADTPGLSAITRLQLVTAGGPNTSHTTVHRILARADYAALLAVSMSTATKSGMYHAGMCTSIEAIHAWGRHLPVSAWTSLANHTLPLEWVSAGNPDIGRVARNLWFHFDGTLSELAETARLIAVDG